MKKQILLLIFGIASTIGAYAQSTEAQSLLSKEDNQFFIENKGQWPEEVLYVTRIGGLDAWITNNGVLYDFYKLEEEPSNPNKISMKRITGRIRPRRRTECSAE